MFHMLSGTELNCVRKLSNTQSMVVNSPSIVDSLNISRCLVVSESTIKELSFALHMKSLCMSSITLSGFVIDLLPLLETLPLPTHIDGIDLMELEELERREIIERHQEYMIRQIATDTGTPAQLLRAVNWITFITLLRV